MICEGRQFEPGREQGPFFLSSFTPKYLFPFSSRPKYSLKLPWSTKEKKKKKKKQFPLVDLTVI